MGKTPMSKLRKIASFLRWRLVPVRYLTMFKDLKWNYLFKSYAAKSKAVEEIHEIGFHLTSAIDTELLGKIQEIYKPRSSIIIPKPTGHPFVNIFKSEDIDANNPVFQLAFSEKVLDAAVDYFGNKLILDSIQVLYSYSTNGEIRESQHWHLDYGDRKSFHAITYLNDVREEGDGPFVFVDKEASKKIGRSLLVRRITDAKFSKEINSKEVQQFLGPAGSMVLVDPAACYHYGSRCDDSRMAVFITFSSWFPYAQPMEIVTQNREKIFSEASKVRPDLNPKLLRNMLQLG